MSKGVIYYTNNNVENFIRLAAITTIFEAELPVWSASLVPIRFGENAVIEGESGYPTMVRQIVSCLERAETDVVFFCEHDVLYSPSHFWFEPAKEDTYYYNLNNWRWDYPHDRLIHYDGLTSLSQLCVYRDMALRHFINRLAKIMELPQEEFLSKEPKIPRVWGYEPGRKSVTSGGFSDEPSDTWMSKYPNIDIRHDKTYSPPKTNLKDFKHQPTGWKEYKIDNISGWNIRELFNIWN